MAEMARSEVTSSVLLVAGSWLDARFDDECVGNGWKLDRRARRLCGESWNLPIACGLKWASIEEHPAAEQGRRCDEIELRWRLAVRKCQRCWMTPVEVERAKRRAGRRRRRAASPARATAGVGGCSCPSGGARGAPPSNQGLAGASRRRSTRSHCRTASGG